MTAPLRAVVLAVVAVVVLVAAGIGWLAIRAPVTTPSPFFVGITIQCSAATGVSSETCGRWGDQVLDADPAPHTFERKDLRRVTFDRSLFGFGDTCTVAWFIERDPDEPVWSGAVPCR